MKLVHVPRLLVRKYCPAPLKALLKKYVFKPLIDRKPPMRKKTTRAFMLAILSNELSGIQQEFWATKFLSGRTWLEKKANAFDDIYDIIAAQPEDRPLLHQHVPGRWCEDLSCSFCYGVSTWAVRRINELELKLLEQQRVNIELRREVISARFQK